MEPFRWPLRKVPFVNFYPNDQTFSESTGSMSDCHSEEVKR